MSRLSLHGNTLENPDTVYGVPHSVQTIRNPCPRNSLQQFTKVAVDRDRQAIASLGLGDFDQCFAKGGGRREHGGGQEGQKGEKEGEHNQLLVRAAMRNLISSSLENS